MFAEVEPTLAVDIEISQPRAGDVFNDDLAVCLFDVTRAVIAELVLLVTEVKLANETVLLVLESELIVLIVISIANHGVLYSVGNVLELDAGAVSERDSLVAFDPQVNTVHAWDRGHLADAVVRPQAIGPFDDDGADGWVVANLLAADAATVGQDGLIGLTKDRVEWLAEDMTVLHKGNGACHDHLEPEKCVIALRGGIQINRDWAGDLRKHVKDGAWGQAFDGVADPRQVKISREQLSADLIYQLLESVLQLDLHLWVFQL